MKNFLDISGLERFLENWYNLIFGFKQEEKIIQDNLQQGPFWERSINIQNMNISPGFSYYPLFGFVSNLITVVPEKTSLILSVAETGNSFIINDFGTYDIYYNPDNYLSIYTDGQGNICFYASGFNTTLTISGIITVRYILS